MRVRGWQEFFRRLFTNASEPLGQPGRESVLFHPSRGNGQRYVRLIRLA